MKKILFASTAVAGLAFAGVASAEIALFGDARLGIGYNIENDGDAIAEDDDAYEEFRAVSRVRFGVTMSGETDTGITYGATIRADNAGGGQGGSDGQTDGNVFVSGAFGTLTMGDTNAADEQHTGDASGGVGITGLGDFNETLFISNGGGGFGSDGGVEFAENPEARPTVRYDYNFGGLGVSASTNRDLTDVGVGLSYTAELGGGSITGGLGYNDFSEFTLDDTGDVISGGEQWTAALTGSFNTIDFGVVYSDASAGASDLEVVYLGLGTSFDRIGVTGFWNDVLEGTGDAEGLDGQDSYGLGLSYDLGGGAELALGVAETRNGDTVGDFGIGLSF